MGIKIRKYNAEKLKEFIESPEFMHMPAIPVSKHRALSYLNNPRLEREDIIMYLAFEGHEMIGYRCILPDRINGVKTGWLSGNWVKPEKRRQGISTLLFNEVYKDWDLYLIYTNYAPESKLVYDKTGKFNLFKELQGVRAYLRFDLAELLPPKRNIFKRIRPLFSVTDTILNLFQDLRLMFYREETLPDNYRVVRTDRVDEEIVDFLKSGGMQGISDRGKDELNWIINYPWILKMKYSDGLNTKYHFSSTSAQYENINIKVYDQQDRLILYIMMVVIGKKMTIPYSCFDKANASYAGSIIMSYMFSMKLSYLTVFNPWLVEHIKSKSYPFLLRKKMSRKFFATRKLIKELQADTNVFIADGDGDCVFT